MEELTVYRYRIGLFTCIAYKKSSNKRPPKRKPKSRVSTRKVKVKKAVYKQATHVRNKMQEERHPSRIAFLFLLVFIPLVVTNQFLHVTNLSNNSLHGKFALNVNIDNVLDRGGLLGNFIHTFQSSSTGNDQCLRTKSPIGAHVNNLSEYENEPTENILLNSFSILSGGDILTNIKEQICDKFLRLLVNDTIGGQLRSPTFLHHHFRIILVGLILLCCLRTCSYLLGNKGAHCYNGNTIEQEEKRKPGDAWLTKETLRMIKSHVDESVGLIKITKSNSNGTRSVEGTGFRVGSRYVMTAYHVFKAEIVDVLVNIKYEVDSKNKDSIFRKISKEFGETVTKPDTEPSVPEVCAQIDTYVKRTFTNIPKLLSLLKDSIDTETLRSRMTQTWKESCAVIFMGGNEFQVDWEIPFGDEDKDIIIVNLIDSASLPFPKPLLLDKDFKQLNNIHIIRFIGDDQIVMDQSTTTFKDDTELDTFVKGAIEWWKQKFSSTDVKFFSEKYKNCVKSHDEESGRVVLRASKSFTHGASGSPIVYLFNSDGQPVVGMIYQRGYPEFYYNALVQGKGTFSKVKINKDRCLLEGGTTMKKLAELLDVCELRDLKEDIFSLPKEMVAYEVEAKEFQRIDEELKKVKDLMEKSIGKQDEAYCLLGKLNQKFDHVLERTCFIDSQKLNTMIEQTRIYLETQTAYKPYVKTEAHMEAEEILRVNNVIVITGNPGDGKTALAYQLMKSMSCSVNTARCLRPLMLHNSEQFHELIEPNNALCVMIDDIFGSVVAESYKLQSWGNILGTLFSSFQTGNSSQNNVLIVTLRKDILNICLPQKSHIIKEEITLDLSSKRFMTREFMSKLLGAYLSSSDTFKPFTEKELDEIYKYSPNIGFPQCCKMASESKEFKSRGVQFFEKPNYFLLQEVKNLLYIHEANNKYCSLLFLFLYPKYSFNNTSEKDEKKTKIINCLENIFDFKWGGSEKLRKTLLAMRGLYITCDGERGPFRFSHESVQTAIAFSFASLYTSHFIQLCESRHLHILVTTNETDIDQGKVKIADDDIAGLIERIKQLLQTKVNRAQTFRHIADMQVWNNREFIVTWSEMDEDKLISVDHLDQKGNSMLVYFTEREMLVPLDLCFSASTSDKICKTQLDLGLKSACKTGNLKLVDYFLSKSVNPSIEIFVSAVKGRNLNILSKLIEKCPTVLKYGRDVAQFYPFCLPTSVTVLHCACYEGNVCMVKHICENCESLVNAVDGHGRNCLHIASFQGHLDVCEYLLQHFPFLLYQTYKGRLPIHETAESGHIECFNLIAECVLRTHSSIDSYISTMTDQSETIYHLACRGAKSEMCLHIQEEYPFLIEITEEFHPLHAAAWSGDIQLFQKILESCGKKTENSDSKDFVSSCLDKSGSSVLHFACKNGKTDV